MQRILQLTTDLLTEVTSDTTKYDHVDPTIHEKKTSESLLLSTEEVSNAILQSITSSEYCTTSRTIFNSVLSFDTFYTTTTTHMHNTGSGTQNNNNKLSRNHLILFSEILFESIHVLSPFCWTDNNATINTHNNNKQSNDCRQNTFFH